MIDEQKNHRSRRYTDEGSGLSAVGRPLPSDLQAEQALLGSLLTLPDGLNEIDSWFDGAWFSSVKHQWIYEAVQQCRTHDPPIVPDISSVASMLDSYMVDDESTRLNLVGGMSYLGELGSHTPTPDHIQHYAVIVMDKAIRRQLIEITGKIAALGYDERQPLREVLTQAEDMLATVTGDRSTMDALVHLGQVFTNLFDDEQQRRESDPQDRFVPTPFYDLNDYLGGGLQRGDLIVLAARPGVGKTAFAQTLTLESARQGLTVLFFSLEMDRSRVAYRFLSMQTGIPSQACLACDWMDNEEQLATMINAMGELSNLNIYINDRKDLHTQTIQSIIQHAQRHIGPPDLVIVDYLQLLSGTGNHRRAETRDHEIGVITTALKAMAEEFRVPMLVIAQLNRSADRRTSHVPMLSDIRESGWVEQSADQVIFLYREEMYDKNTDRKGIAELHIAKNRYGETGMVPLAFDAKTTTFRNLAWLRNQDD